MTTTTSTTTSKLSTSLSNPSSSSIGGPVTASINFFVPPADGSAPYHYVEEPPEGIPRDNFTSEDRAVPIQDIRGRESDFTLDRDAFQAIGSVAPSAETAWTDDEHIKTVYYPELERLLLSSIPGAKKVIFFDHTIRRSSPNAHRAPVTRAHVDQTQKSTVERVRLHTSSAAEADELLQGRYRIVNVWRPINGTVEASPLGFASATSVDPATNLVPVQHRYPHRNGETAAVKYSEGLRWYYWSGMGDDERLLLKCWDSADGVGRCVPHTAFVDPNTREGAKGRESIEVRTLVFG